MSGDPVVAVPADLELEDRLAGPVTFRMAGWLAAGAAGVALLVLSREQMWAAGAGVLLAVTGLVGALWRPGGRPAAAWLGPLWSYRRRRWSTGRKARRLEPDGDALAEPVPDGELVPDVEAKLSAITAGGAHDTRRAVRRGAVTALLLAVAVAATVTLRGWAPWWPGDLSPAEAPAAPAAPPTADTADTGLSRPTKPSGTAPAAPAEPRQEGPYVLVPADPFWPLGGHVDSGEGWVGCGC